MSTTTGQASRAGAASIAYQMAMATESDLTVVLGASVFTDVYADIESALIGRELASSYKAATAVRIPAVFDCHGTRVGLEHITFPEDDRLLTAVIAVRTPHPLDKLTTIPVISELKSQIEQAAEAADVVISDWIIVFDARGEQA